ncbi:hypothetical protein ANN_21227, partial [Periplaneta americana]
ESQWAGSLLTSELLFTPLDYFRMFVGTELLETIVQESNNYAIQQNPNKPLNLTVEELEKWLGMILTMSIIKLPATRLYWSRNFRVSIVAETMPCNRFETIKRNLHFCNNLAPGSNTAADPLYKVRSILDHIIKNCNVLPKCEKYSVDEQIIPFKGRSRLKMYNPKKPKKWGYKMFIICDVKGLVYNFELYSGKTVHPEELPNVGASGNVVLRLASILSSGENYKVYFDNNWFCSVALQAALAQQKIWSLGTVRQNRLKGCDHPSDTVMKRKGRGAISEKRCDFENVTYSSVKWFDNRCVTLLSNFVGAEPVRKVKRYDRRQRKYTEVSCPNSVVTYNKFMGDFKTSVAQGLLKASKTSTPQSNKIGRPKNSSLESQYNEKCKKGPAASIPISDVRLDQNGHFPVFQEKKRRIKKPNCKGTPKIKDCVKHVAMQRCYIAQWHNELKRSGKALLDQYQREGDYFLGRIVAMDETWTRSYEPKLKRQSNEWKHPGSPRPKKVRPTQSAVKEMFIVAYDIDGVILHHAVLPRQTVNADYYCKFLQHHLRPALRRKRRYLVVQNPIILHDNARSRTVAAVKDLLRRWQWEILEHSPYSPDKSPCDYDLFVKVKEPLRVTRYNTRDELLCAIGRSIWNINKDGRADYGSKLLSEQISRTALMDSCKPKSIARTCNLTVEEILTTLEEKDDAIQKAETIDLVILPPDNENDTDIDEIPEEDLEFELNSSSTATPLEKTAITTPEAPSASATKRKSSDGVAYSKKEKRVMEKHWDSIFLKPETAEDTKFKIKYSSDNPPEIFETIVGNGMQPLQVFQLFWKPEFLSHICKESKKYAQYKYGDNSYTVDIDEMYKMLGILLLSGYAKLPNRKMYWETQSDVNNPAVSNCVSRNRFLSILKYTHFSDNCENANAGNIHKIQPLLRYISKQCEECAKPLPSVYSFDEAMEPYYGRHRLKQFIRGKPIRFGFKFWCLNTPNGYCVRFKQYEGREERDPSLTLGSSITKQMIEGFVPPLSQHVELGIPLLEFLRRTTIPLLAAPTVSRPRIVNPQRSSGVLSEVRFDGKEHWPVNCPKTDLNLKTDTNKATRPGDTGKGLKTHEILSELEATDTRSNPGEIDVYIPPPVHGESDGDSGNEECNNPDCLTRTLFEAEAEVRFSNETRDDENDSPESTLEATVLLEVEAELEATTKTRDDKNYNPRSVLNTKYIPQNRRSVLSQMKEEDIHYTIHPIKKYNSFMGGVDQMDQNIGAYRIGIRGEKWYVPILLWMFDVAMNNAWLTARSKGISLDNLSFRRTTVIAMMQNYGTPVCSPAAQKASECGKYGRRFSTSQCWTLAGGWSATSLMRCLQKQDY